MRRDESRDNELATALQHGQLGVVYVPRQGYGSLVFAAETATLDHVRFAHRYGSGIMIVSLSAERLRHLDLRPLRSRHSRSPAFTASVDAATGTTTGISASDRLLTIRALADAGSKPADLARPGHIFPIKFNDRWDAHAADAASHLSSRAERRTGVSTAIMDDAGDVLDLDSTVRFFRHHGLPFWGIPDPTTTDVSAPASERETIRAAVTIPYSF